MSPSPQAGGRKKYFAGSRRGRREERGLHEEPGMIIKCKKKRESLDLRPLARKRAGEAAAMVAAAVVVLDVVVVVNDRLTKVWKE